MGPEITTRRIRSWREIVEVINVNEAPRPILIPMIILSFFEKQNKTNLQNLFIVLSVSNVPTNRLLQKTIVDKFKGATHCV